MSREVLCSSCVVPFLPQVQQNQRKANAEKQMQQSSSNYNTILPHSTLINSFQEFAVGLEIMEQLLNRLVNEENSNGIISLVGNNSIKALPTSTPILDVKKIVILLLNFEEGQMISMVSFISKSVIKQQRDLTRRTNEIAVSYNHSNQIFKKILHL